MKKNKKIQLTLISIGLLLILITYFYYPNLIKKKFDRNQTVDKKIEKTLQDERSTIFENLEYKGLYDLDKPFVVKSEKAHIAIEEPDIVYMINMHAILHLSDGRIVNIISDRGRYNKVTYDCFFEQNVKATDGETKILAQNLDLLATENLVEIYNDVSLKNTEGFLIADKINYDFETKSFKVSMLKDKKIKMKLFK